ncbi:MAG: prepilin-type N-terminal cleavage/methylation domain-containing protein [bacterium]
MFRKINKNQKGLTLIELVIAVSIFGIIMVIAIDSFLSVIKVNRESVNVQSTQNHARFLYEMMLKEIKMAKIINDNTCASFDPNSSNIMYKVKDADVNNKNSILKFKNYKDECVIYELDVVTDPNHHKLKISRDSGANYVDVFPNEIDVNSLFFNITNLESAIGAARHIPPSVTIIMELQSNMWDKPVLQLQSTVSSRYIE